MIRAILCSMILSLSVTSLASAQQEADTLSLGVPLDLPEFGEPYVANKFNDWTVHCIRSADGKDPCEMKQLLLNEQNQPMSEISLFKLPEGQPAAAGANLVVPLETLLTEPLTITYDEDTTKQYPYRFCNEVGCYVRIGMTAEEVETLKKGDVADITVVHIARPQTPIRFGMSLSGFTKAFNSLPAVNP